ncbi:hypothetical protein BDR22DRAFT_835528 [Usnea florida]
MDVHRGQKKYDQCPIHLTCTGQMPRPRTSAALAMVGLRASLNAFRDDIVHIYAKMSASLPIQNVNSPQ